MTNNATMERDPVFHQIQLATEVIARCGYRVDCVIKEQRHVAGGEPFYGFHFENDRTVGDEFVQDGVLVKLVFIIKYRPPSLGATVNAVLDAFKELDRKWGNIGTVQASHIGARAYRWTPACFGGHLGVSENDGLTLRRATDLEYAALEKGLGAGQVQITQFNRITRKDTCLHQATGRAMPMD